MEPQQQGLKMVNQEEMLRKGVMADLDSKAIKEHQENSDQLAFQEKKEKEESPCQGHKEAEVILENLDFREIMEDLGVMGIKVQLDFRGLRVTKVNLDRVQQAHLVWMDCLDCLEEKASGDSLE